MIVNPNQGSKQKQKFISFCLNKKPSSEKLLTSNERETETETLNEKRFCFIIEYKSLYV